MDFPEGELIQSPTENTGDQSQGCWQDAQAMWAPGTMRWS